MVRRCLQCFALAAFTLAAFVVSIAGAGLVSADRGQGHGPEQAGSHESDHARGRPARIAWEQRRIEIELAPGETKTMTVHFTPSRAIAHAMLDVRPGHAPLDVTPHDLGAVEAGESQAITLTAHLPADEHHPRRNAVVFVRDGRRSLGPPLRVVIRNTGFEERDEDEEDDEDELVQEAHVQWTPPEVRAVVQRGGTFTTTVTFVADQALEHARITTRAQDGVTVTVSPADVGPVAAFYPVTLTLTAQVPADFDRERFAADLAVFDGAKRLEPRLELRLRIVGSEPEPAEVAWTPPIVIATVQPGQTYTTTVSFVASRSLSGTQVIVLATEGLTVTTNPASVGSVTASTPITLTITALVPAGTGRPFFMLRLSLRDEERTLEVPLWIVLNVVRP